MVHRQQGEHGELGLGFCRLVRHKSHLKEVAGLCDKAEKSNSAGVWDSFNDPPTLGVVRRSSAALGRGVQIARACRICWFQWPVF